MKKLIITLSVITLVAFSTVASAATYTCKPGDTLADIAKKYQINLNQLKSSNPQLNNSSAIKPGQPINIPSTASLDSYEQEVFKLVNQERAKAGLQKLTYNYNVAKTARAKSQDMINKNYFAHQSPTYGSPFNQMEQAGIRFSSAAENIAKGQRTPAEVMKSWMNSPGHRANILSKTITQIGVGCAKAKNGTLYWTQQFIKPLK